MRYISPGLRSLQRVLGENRDIGVSFLEVFADGQGLVEDSAVAQHERGDHLARVDGRVLFRELLLFGKIDADLAISQALQVEDAPHSLGCT